MRKNIANRAIEILKEEGIRSFSRKALAYKLCHIENYVTRGLELPVLPYAILRIKGLNRDCTLAELLDFAFNECAGLIKPNQNQSEVLGLLEVISGTNPNVILEIGTANGGTLFLFSRIASEDAIIISIDLPGGRFGEGYPAWRIRLYKSFARSSQRMCLLRTDSHRRDTLERVKAILDGREIDFLFIDGDHSYEGAKMDFEMYGALVKKGGIVAIHDMVTHLPEVGCEVNKLWEELKLRYNHLEPVEDYHQN